MTLTLQASPPTASSPFKAPRHPGWNTINIRYDCWFPRHVWRCVECGRQHDEADAGQQCHGVAAQIWVADGVAPPIIWDAARAMQHQWNSYWREFRALRDVEPLECTNGHQVTREHVYRDPNRRRGEFCALCRDEGKPRVYVNSALRGKARGDYYRPLLTSLNATAQRYAEFWRCTASHCPTVALSYAEANACHGAAEKRKLPSACYYDVAFRFGDTLGRWRNKPQLFNPPRYKRWLDSIRFTMKFKDGGQPIHRFTGLSGGWAGIVNTLKLKPAPGEPLTEEYLKNGYMMYDGQREPRIDLHVAYHTPLPGTNPALLNGDAPDEALMWKQLAERHLAEYALVKEVVISGKLRSPFGFNEIKSWGLVVTIQAPFPVEPRENNCVAALDLSWRRLSDPDRLRIGVLYDGHQYHEMFIPLDLASQRERKNLNRHREAPKLVSPRANWDLESRIGAGVEACKVALVALDKQDWPADALQTWAGHVKMREAGLRRLRGQLAQASITLPALEEWSREYATLFRWSRHLEIALQRKRNALFRNLADGIAKQCQVLVLDALKIEEKKRRPGKRKTARKDKHEATDVWDARTVDERIEENAAKNRDFAALALFRQYLLEACRKRGVEVLTHSNANPCAECGAPINFGYELHADCPGCGIWQEKNRNAALEEWNAADVASKDGAPAFDLSLVSEQARRGLQRMVNPSREPEAVAQ